QDEPDLVSRGFHQRLLLVGRGTGGKEANQTEGAAFGDHRARHHAGYADQAAGDRANRRGIDVLESVHERVDLRPLPDERSRHRSVDRWWVRQLEEVEVGIVALYQVDGNLLELDVGSR